MYTIDTLSPESLQRPGNQTSQRSRRSTRISLSLGIGPGVENAAATSCLCPPQSGPEQGPSLRAVEDAGCSEPTPEWRAQRLDSHVKTTKRSSEVDENPPRHDTTLLKLPVRGHLPTRSRPRSLETLPANLSMRSPPQNQEPLLMGQMTRPWGMEMVSVNDMKTVSTKTVKARSMRITDMAAARTMAMMSEKGDHQLLIPPKARYLAPTSVTSQGLSAIIPPTSSREPFESWASAARGQQSSPKPEMTRHRGRNRMPNSQNSSMSNAQHETTPGAAPTRARPRIQSQDNTIKETCPDHRDMSVEVPGRHPLPNPMFPGYPDRHTARLCSLTPRLHRLDTTTPAGPEKCITMRPHQPSILHGHQATSRVRSCTDQSLYELGLIRPSALKAPSEAAVVIGEKIQETTLETASPLPMQVLATSQLSPKREPAIAVAVDKTESILNEEGSDRSDVRLKPSGPRWLIPTTPTISTHLHESAFAHNAELDLHTQSDDSPISPTYYGNEDESEVGDCDTPLTSPCTSPVKSRPRSHRFPPLGLSRAQLDGADFDSSDYEELDEADSEEDGRFARLPPRPSSTTHAYRTGPSAISRDVSPRRVPDLRSPQRESDIRNAEEYMDNEDATPLTQASKAKGAKSFAFPVAPSVRTPASLLSAQRHPSALLRHCERSTTPRQRRLMAGTVQSPDRFIPSRTSTPSKEAFLTRTSAPKQTNGLSPVGRTVILPDPFGPVTTHGPRAEERFATIRRLAPMNRPPRGPGTTLTPNGAQTSRRAVSTGAVWTVGSTIVTEGVASITNGRGGRVTSSTSAPHYTSDFLHRQSPSEEELIHGQRLAVAMDVDEASSMFAGSPTLTGSPDSSSRRRAFSDSGRRKTFWNNNSWETEVAFTPSKQSKQKPKAVPVIPFRVLDAPFLRDDYYCSLLAYSPTLQCLAVSLGRHVYLWSERGSMQTEIPNSLTSMSPAHVTSLSFSSVEGGSAILAIGRANGAVTLWSPQDEAPRFDSLQPSPVSCVCFRPTAVKRVSVRESCETVLTEELLVGDETGHVFYYSVEWPNKDKRDLFDWQGSMTLIAKMTCHAQQVCGLAWSKNGEYIATGGNDNQLFLFETRKLFSKSRSSQASTTSVLNGNATDGSPVSGQGEILAITHGHHKHLFTLNAAVKAISFAPWQSSLVAAGGGSNDRCIHFFHALSGATLATIDCHAQVTSLVWSEKRKEIAATFGFAQPEHPYRVAVFAWPSCRRVVGIPWWSEERALYAVAYPGGPAGGGVAQRSPHERTDGEGRPWSGNRTREEGCLVIATSNASIKFHEVWADKGEGSGKRTGGDGGILGGSQILEDGVSYEVERSVAIR